MVTLAVLLTAQPKEAKAEVLRDDGGHLQNRLHVPIYHWSDPSSPPRGVILAIHGMTKHGGSYDGLARYLAPKGFIVIASDVRGYGRWYKRELKGHEQNRVDYVQAQKDFVTLLTEIRKTHPTLPLFLMGESMGASLAIRLASVEPNSIDGLILSSPALRRHHYFGLGATMCAEMGQVLCKPKCQLDLTPYMRRYASEDPRIVAESFSEPLTRCNLSMAELLHTRDTMKATLHYIENIPSTMPVLVLQGNRDRTLKANAVLLLISRLKSTDQTVKWLPRSGHILLETAFLQPTILESLDIWLNTHARSRAVQAAQGTSVLETSMAN